MTQRLHSLSPGDQLFLKKVGRRIGEIRRKRGFTQSELAEKCSLSLQMIQYWESGRNLTLKSLFRLSQLLNHPISDFMKEPRDMETKMGRPVGFKHDGKGLDGKGKKHRLTSAQLRKLPRLK